MGEILLPALSKEMRDYIVTTMNSRMDAMADADVNAWLSPEYVLCENIVSKLLG